MGFISHKIFLTSSELFSVSYSNPPPPPHISNLQFIWCFILGSLFRGIPGYVQQLERDIKDDDLVFTKQ